MTCRLDIVIPTYDRPHLIRPLVEEYLLPQCIEGDRIRVVWQGSESPGFPLSQSSSPVEFIRQERPNLPAARNRGLEASQADIILFLDDDVVPAPDLVAAHRACYGDPEIAGVAGFVDDPLFTAGRPLPSYIDLSNGDLFQNFMSPASRKTVSAMGANMSFRRSALAAVDGFDERYKRNALWEEVDCCLRLLAKGYSLWYCAGAKVRHLRSEQGGCRSERRRRYLYHQFANTVFFALRFVKPEQYRAWCTSLKYRLEYLSRADNGRDFGALLAGVAGIAGGIARFYASVLSRDPQRDTIDKAALRKTLAALGSKG